MLAACAQRVAPYPRVSARPDAVSLAEPTVPGSRRPQPHNSRGLARRCDGPQRPVLSTSLAFDGSRPVASLTVTTVLVATDADWIHADVDAALADDSTEVLRVNAGREVPAAVAENEPKLVVLDLQIGNMGGIATFIHLRQEAEAARLPTVPVLLLLDRAADVPLTRQTGLDGWLVKPLDRYRLRRAAEALLDGETFHEPSGLAEV